MMIGFATTVMALLGGGQISPMPLLSPVFGSHMVMQRDRPNTIWGWAAPGTEVSVTIADRHAKATSDGNGKWTLKIKPPPTGGPYTMTVDGPQHLQLDDILVGDVWICSGQSNMEMGIGLVNNSAAEIAQANQSNIRLYMVPHDIALTPQAVNPAEWAVCSPQTVAAGGWSGFSAAAYFFGRQLNSTLNVPIGLVQTCWGGTIAEAWTSEAGLRPMRDFDAGIESVANERHGPSGPIEQRIDAWFAAGDPGSKSGAEWQARTADPAGWKVISMPASFEASGLSQFDGIVWYRREIDLPNVPEGAAVLSLGAIDDMDTTWVNGVKVGETRLYNADRRYTVPAGVLRPGRNGIAVRVLDTGQIGGFTSPASFLSIHFRDDSQVSLAGEWRYRVGPDLGKLSPFPQQLGDNPNVPTVLYNGMIAPIAPLAMKGAIWYQGESNSGRGYQYRMLLPTLISDWRRTWGEGDFPFLIVQLANFQTRRTEPSDDDWAEVREAQAMTARKVRNAGLAVAIDIGDDRDIHPKDKQDVGARLALAALHVAYRVPGPYSGPTYRSSRREGNGMRITFDNTQGGLASKAGLLRGFAVAGDNHKFYWAQAEIQGDTVFVRSPDVPNPVAVRYAWDMDPEATLYNAAKLPAVPFRTDDWHGMSYGKK